MHESASSPSSPPFVPTRDPSDLTLYRAESFGKKSKKEDLLPLSDTLEMHLSPRSTKGLEVGCGHHNIAKIQTCLTPCFPWLWELV